MASEPAYNYPLTQGYGPTTFTSEPSLYGYQHFHNGLDFAAPMGTPVYAPQAGTISAAGSDATGIAYGGAGNFGNRVLLGFKDGFTALFGHLSKVDVSPGQQVQAGQLIGYTGDSGNSTGAHLHVGLYDPQGQPVNPYSIPLLSGLQGKVGGLGSNIGDKMSGLGSTANATASGLLGVQGSAQSSGPGTPQLQIFGTPFGPVTIPVPNFTVWILVLIGIIAIYVGLNKLGTTRAVGNVISSTTKSIGKGAEMAAV